MDRLHLIARLKILVSMPLAEHSLKSIFIQNLGESEAARRI